MPSEDLCIGCAHMEGKEPAPSRTTIFIVERQAEPYRLSHNSTAEEEQITAEGQLQRGA